MSLLHKSKRTRGQGLVEFAVILPVLLFLVIGTLDLGFVFFVKVALENSAREGAYFLVYNNTVNSRDDDFAEVKSRVGWEAENSGITIAAEDIDVECMVGGSVNNSCPSGSTVIVTIQQELALAVDIFLDGPLQLTNQARMLIP